MSFICTILDCNTSFTDRALLLRHKNKNHLCIRSSCSIKFANAESREAHIQTAHGKHLGRTGELMISFISSPISDFISFQVASDSGKIASKSRSKRQEHRFKPYENKSILNNEKHQSPIIEFVRETTSLPMVEDSSMQVDDDSLTIQDTNRELNGHLDLQKGELYF